eukprot:99804-Prymnesium_polylepis.2
MSRGRLGSNAHDCSLSAVTSRLSGVLACCHQAKPAPSCDNMWKPKSLSMTKFGPPRHHHQALSAVASGVASVEGVTVSRPHGRVLRYALLNFGLRAGQCNSD